MIVRVRGAEAQKNGWVQEQFTGTYCGPAPPSSLRIREWDIVEESYVPLSCENMSNALIESNSNPKTYQCVDVPEANRVMGCFKYKLVGGVPECSECSGLSILVELFDGTTRSKGCSN